MAVSTRPKKKQLRRASKAPAISRLDLLGPMWSIHHAVAQAPSERGASPVE